MNQEHRGPHHNDSDAHVRRSLDHIEHELKKLVEKIHHMSIELDNLKTQVATTISLETQAIAILNAGGGSLPASDLAQVVVLSGQLKTSSDALAAALAGGGTGSGGSEAADAQDLVSIAQQAAGSASDSVQVARLVTVMQAKAASLSAAFTRNTPPLSVQVTQQLVVALAAISALISNLSTLTTSPAQVTSLSTQIQNAASSLSALIAANPRSGPVPRRF